LKGPIVENEDCGYNLRKALEWEFKMAQNKKESNPVGYCVSCEKPLFRGDMVYYLEDSLERRFCQESCIESYFQFMIDELVEELKSLRSKNDLSESRYHHYHSFFQETSEAPDEIWLESDPKGGKRHILIRQFEEEGKRIWYVVIATLLGGQPSFVQIAFPTKDPELLKHYQRGIRLAELPNDNVHPELEEPEAKSNLERFPQRDPELFQQEKVEMPENEDSEDEDELVRDELRAKVFQDMLHQRKESDIPMNKFEEYSYLEEQTLDFPDEIYEWNNPDGRKLLSYLATYGEEIEEVQVPANSNMAMKVYQNSSPQLQALTYVVVCELVPQGQGESLGNEEHFHAPSEEWEEGLAIPLVSFPTLNDRLANNFRKGKRLDLGDPIH
jgi:hypothetical protein